MKTSKFDNLNDAFNVESISPDKIIQSPEENKIVKKDILDNVEEDIKKDYKYTRGQLYSIIEKGQEAINGILEDVNKEEEQKGPSTVNNALFVGSTSELSKLLKSGINQENK